MKIKIDRATLNIELEGCLNCGTLWGFEDEGVAVRAVKITVDGMPYIVYGSLCLNCHGNKKYPYGQPLSLGNVRIVIRNNTGHALQFTFKGETLRHTVFANSVLEISGDYDALELTGADILPVTVAAQIELDKTCVKVFCHEKKTERVNGLAVERAV